MKTETFKTYQDVEKHYSEKQTEFDSIFAQLDFIDKELTDMHKRIIILREYLKGSIYFDTGEL